MTIIIGVSSNFGKVITLVRENYLEDDYFFNASIVSFIITRIRKVTYNDRKSIIHTSFSFCAERSFIDTITKTLLT